jgi:uncharacterized damage-inducible protein DinB
MRSEELHMKPLILLPVIFGFACAGFAETPNPITNSDKAIYVLVMSNVLKAAEQMPEADYAFKAAPDVRSFGQLIGHLADGQYEFCGPAIGDQTKRPSVEKTKTTKADLVQALKDAYGYCGKAYEGMTDAKGAETVAFARFQVARLSLLGFNTAHTDEHYGNIATYMRMKGMVPPSSQPRVVPAQN